MVIFTLTDDSIQNTNITETKTKILHNTRQPVSQSEPQVGQGRPSVNQRQPDIVIRIFFVDVTLTVDLKSSLSLSIIDSGH